VRPAAATDRSLARLFVGLLIFQLVLGSLLRHLAAGLLVHIAFAAIVGVVGIALGVRAWGVHGDVPTLKRSGRAVMHLIAVQIALGIVAAVVVDGRLGRPDPPARDVIFTTLHQANGAMLLATAVGLLLWLQRSVTPA
jgi:heme A synthase